MIISAIALREDHWFINPVGDWVMKITKIKRTPKLVIVEAMNCFGEYSNFWFKLNDKVQLYSE